jgi:hypothetical protein
MQILVLLLLIAFCLGNARRARIKGLNPVPWVIYTIVGFFAGTFIASYLIIFKHPALIEFAKLNDQAGMKNYMLKQMPEQLLLVYTALIFAGGLGGYLLIRYLLERKPFKKS